MNPVRLARARCRIASLAAAILLGLLPGAHAVAAPATEDAESLVTRLGLQEAPGPVSQRPGWRKPARILVPGADGERLAWLQRAAPGVELVPVDSLEEAVAAAPGADAVIGMCHAEVLAAGQDIG